jgi:hypothetical protein
LECGGVRPARHAAVAGAALPLAHDARLRRGNRRSAGATADLHTRITSTAEATQVAAASYEANEADSVDAIKNVISTVTNAVQENT